MESAARLPGDVIKIKLKNGRKAEVTCDILNYTGMTNVKLTLTNTSKTETGVVVRAVDESELTTTFDLCPGDSYYVTLKARYIKVPFTYRIKNKSAEFRAELQKDELKVLMRRAENHTNPKRSSNQMQRCKHLYRNKPCKYYEDIIKKRDGIMEVYIKDNNGEQASPINGQINGLFFSATCHHSTGKPPPTSPFGDRRLLVQSELLFHKNTNLYFADFYCTTSNIHYVTLVLTNAGSDTDAFCQKKLITLDSTDNPFLCREADGFVYARQSVWVEVLYTEDIDITTMGKFRNVISTGTSRPGGIAKDPNCKVCNLPHEIDSTEEIMYKLRKLLMYMRTNLK